MIRTPLIRNLQSVCLACFFGAAVLVSSASPGCALQQQGREEVSAALERHQGRMAADASRYARIATTAPAGPKGHPASRPSGSAQELSDLQRYIKLALKNNPKIRQAEQLARAEAERIPQVTALPDPMLHTKTLPEPIRTAEGDNYFVLSITQKWPHPAKLDRAGRVALEATRMALAEWDRVRLQIIADVKRAYYRIYVIDRTTAVIRENRALIDGLVESIRGQVVAGQRTQDDILRAQVELSQLDARLIRLRRERRRAVAWLNNLMNRAPEAAIASPESFTLRDIDVTLDALLTRAIEVNPELRKLRNRLDRDRQSVALAKLAYWPDFNLGFEWMLMKPRPAFEPSRNPQTGRRPEVPTLSEDGSDNWAILFGFNVPVWYDAIAAEVREARRRLSASMEAYASARNDVHFRIEDAWAGVTAQRELAVLFQDSVIPRARQAYEIARVGYTVGRSDFQYVVDNWQQWLAAEIQYYRAMGELERSVADLEEAIGLSLNELTKPPVSGS